MKLTKTQANILYIVLIIVVLGFMVFVIYMLLSHTEAFINNPIVYGIDKMGLDDCVCSCFNKANTQPISFYVNSTSLEILN